MRSPSRLAPLTGWLLPAAALIVATAVPAVAAAERTTEPSTASSFEARIVGQDEPGTPLRIAGRIVDRSSGASLAGARMVVYHADDGGEYEPSDPNDESTARLRADVTSAADGSFAFRTILPGEYPNQPAGNRHIHVHAVEADGYVTRGFVILFDDNVRDEVRSWATDTGYGEIIELADDQGELSGFLEIWLEPTSEPSPVPERPVPADD